MGTSQSSSGPPSNVRLVPPWADTPVPAETEDGDAPGGDEHGGQEDATRPERAQPATMAPARRFMAARTSLGRFAQRGESDAMRRGLGHYVHKGLGGSHSATRRFQGTARTAGVLYRVLSGTGTGVPGEPRSSVDSAVLTGRTSDEVIGAVVEAVRRVDGTQDAEASRRAVSNALSELLTRFPGAELSNLSEDQRVFAAGQYVACDVYNRFRLDVGKSLQARAPDASTALSRFREVKEYIREVINSAFVDARRSAINVTAQQITRMSKRALTAAFAVFETYLE